MRDAKFFLLAAVALVVVGCTGGDASSSKDEERNFREGMTKEKVKEVGPPPTPPAGPLPGYEGGSAADKAQGR